MEELGAAAAVVRWKLETGRTHQIRVHAKQIGHPLVMDETYGGTVVSMVANGRGGKGHGMGSAGAQWWACCPFWAAVFGATSWSDFAVLMVSQSTATDQHFYSLLPHSDGKQTLAFHRLDWLQSRLTSGIGKSERDKVLPVAKSLSRPALHAMTLAFDHPVTGERLHFRCLPPEDLLALLKALGSGMPLGVDERGG